MIDTSDLKVGDVIRCRDKQDMIVTDYDLCAAGYGTEYIYKINGEDVLAIEIRKLPEKKEEL